MTANTDFAKTAAKRRMTRVSDRIERILHGLPPEQQELILAHLVALFLAGHFVAAEFDKPQRPETEKAREVLLLRHKLLVRQMLPEAEYTVLASHGADAVAEGPMH